MKLIIQRDTLLEYLTGLGRVVPRKSSLPVLQSIRIEADTQRAKITATDLDQVLSCTVTAIGFDKPGIALVAHDQLLGIVKGAQRGPVSMEATGGGLDVSYTLANQTMTRRLPTLDITEWPNCAPSVEAKPVDPRFLATYQRLAPFVASDETRRVITGISLERGKDGDWMIATNGRYLTAASHIKLPITSCIVPVSKFLTWNKLNGDGLQMGYSDEKGSGWFRVVAGGWDYHVRTIDGVYPNWRQVVPTDTGHNRLTIADEDRVILEQALPTFGGKTSAITFQAESGHLVATASSEEGEAKLALPKSKLEGTSISVDRFLLLASLKAGFQAFSYVDCHSPMKGEDGNGGLHVLMPMRMGSVATSAPKPEPATKKEEPVKEPTKSEPTALDRLLVAYETAKGKVREANEALAGIAVAVKDALKEDKQRRAEIDSVRAGLARLQSIKV